MTKYKDVDSMILDFAKKFSFIGEEKFFELKDQANDLLSQNVKEDDNYLTFRQTFSRMLWNYSKKLFEADDDELRKNIINKYIECNYTRSIIPSENLSSLKVLGAAFSSMNIVPTEKYFSIIFSNELFSDILKRITNCYLNLIESSGVDSLIDGESFENARIILKAYYYSRKKTNDNQKVEESSEIMLQLNDENKNEGLRRYFNRKGYSDEQYNSMYFRLPMEYIDIINARFTENGVNEWQSKQQQTYFNNVMIPNMIRMMKDSTYIPKVRKKKLKDKQNQEQININLEEKIEKKLPDIDIYEYYDENLYEDDKHGYDMISLPEFEKFLRTRTIKDIVITGLRYGGINGKQYTFEEIAYFMGKSKDDIQNCMAEVLLGYESFICNLLDDLIHLSNMEIAGKKIENFPTKSENVILDYGEYLKNSPLKWIAIAGLNMGYVTGICIETANIAEFLEFDQKDVISVIRNSLVGYKKYNERVINGTISNLNINSIDMNMQKRKGTKQ